MKTSTFLAAAIVWHILFCLGAIAHDDRKKSKEVPALGAP